MDVSDVSWTIIMLVAAGLINIFMITKRNLREYGSVGIWALMAISVSNNNANGSQSVVITCYIISVIILVFIVMSALKNKNSSLGKM